MMRKTIKIKVNGIEIPAYRGDAVLAPLVAAGYKVLKKSHRLKENRGPLCGMGVCYECQVTINGIANQRACMTEVEDQMVVSIDEP